MKNAELTSGKLLVHDLRGKVVFRSVWDKATLTWSKSQARSLTQPVYFFTFRGNDGKNLNGRVTLTAGF
jgi:hypothetical protein